MKKAGVRPAFALGTQLSGKEGLLFKCVQPLGDRPGQIRENSFSANGWA